MPARGLFTVPLGSFECLQSVRNLGLHDCRGQDCVRDVFQCLRMLPWLYAPCIKQH
jgi:hypothetical protein